MEVTIGLNDGQRRYEIQGSEKDLRQFDRISFEQVIVQIERRFVNCDVKVYYNADIITDVVVTFDGLDKHMPLSEQGIDSVNSVINSVLDAHDRRGNTKKKDLLSDLRQRVYDAVNNDRIKTLNVLNWVQSQWRSQTNELVLSKSDEIVTGLMNEFVLEWISMYNLDLYLIEHTWPELFVNASHHLDIRLQSMNSFIRGMSNSGLSSGNDLQWFNFSNVYRFNRQSMLGGMRLYDAITSRYTILWRQSNSDFSDIRGYWARHIYDHGNVPHIHVFDDLQSLERYCLAKLLATWRSRDELASYDPPDKSIRLFEFPITSVRSNAIDTYRKAVLLEKPKELSLDSSNTVGVVDNILTQYVDKVGIDDRIDQLIKDERSTTLLINKIDYDEIDKAKIVVRVVSVEIVGQNMISKPQTTLFNRYGWSKHVNLMTGGKTRYPWRMNCVFNGLKIRLPSLTLDLHEIIKSVSVLGINYNTYDSDTLFQLTRGSGKYFYKDLDNRFSPESVSKYFKELFTNDLPQLMRLLLLWYAFRDVNAKIEVDDDGVLSAKSLPGNKIRKHWNMSLIKNIGLFYNWVIISGYEVLTQEKNVLLLGSGDDPFITYLNDSFRNYKVTGIGGQAVLPALQGNVPYINFFRKYDVVFSDIDQVSEIEYCSRNSKRAIKTPDPKVIKQIKLLNYCADCTNHFAYVKINGLGGELMNFLKTWDYDTEIMIFGAQKPGTDEVFIRIDVMENSSWDDEKIANILKTLYPINALDVMLPCNVTSSDLNKTTLSPGQYGIYDVTDKLGSKVGTRLAFLQSIGTCVSGKLIRNTIAGCYVTQSKLNLFKRRLSDRLPDSDYDMSLQMLSLVRESSINLTSKSSSQRTYDIAAKLYIHDNWNHNDKIMHCIGSRFLDDMIAVPDGVKPLLQDRDMPIEISDYYDVIVDNTDFVFGTTEMEYSFIAINSIFLNNAQDEDQLTTHVNYVFDQMVANRTTGYFTFPIRFSDVSFSYGAIVKYDKDTKKYTFSINPPTPALTWEKMQKLADGKVHLEQIPITIDRLVNACKREGLNCSSGLYNVSVHLNRSLPVFIASVI